MVERGGPNETTHKKVWASFNTTLLLRFHKVAEPVFVKFKEPRNRFRGIDPPGWESIPGLLNRFTNSGSVNIHSSAFFEHLFSCTVHVMYTTCKCCVKISELMKQSSGGWCSTGQFCHGLVNQKCPPPPTPINPHQLKYCRVGPNH
jgi:hypothetical protein